MHKFAPRDKYTPRGKLVMWTYLPLGAKFTHVGKLPLTGFLCSQKIGFFFHFKQNPIFK